MAIGDADDKWMESYCHHPAVRLALLVEDLELILDGLHKIRPAVPLTQEKGDIVQLGGEG